MYGLSAVAREVTVSDGWTVVSKVGRMYGGRGGRGGGEP